MLIFSFKSGHDASIAIIRDRQLVALVEAEKDSYPRHFFMTPAAIVSAAKLCDGLPDVVAIGGWHHRGPFGERRIGAGYFGHESVFTSSTDFLGSRVAVVESSHERSHIMMALGMRPAQTRQQTAVLVWEGDIGTFYLAGPDCRVERAIPVMSQPGARYSAAYSIADPSFPDGGRYPRLEDAGKVMALAAFAHGELPSASVRETVRRLLALTTCYPVPKFLFRDSPLYNCGLDAPFAAATASALQDAIYSVFFDAAVEHLPPDLPLVVSGGCGLNCDWNSRWRVSPFFSSVFVPPCTDDSGSAIGTGADALFQVTGSPEMNWSVYSGEEFVEDVPLPVGWRRTQLDLRRVVDLLSRGVVVPWVQGRCEIGPRALGNRSLLAEPFSEGTRDRINRLKGRERYRPVAPCCRIEDLDSITDQPFDDPYMLYLRPITDRRLRAVTHVDGTARVQTVRVDDNEALHKLLSAFAAHSGIGVLCNTSLNYKGHGLMNRLSDLLDFCGRTSLRSCVVGAFLLESNSDTA